MMFPLVMVLDELDPQEDAGADQRDCQARHQPAALVELGAADGPGHGQAAEDQHRRVDRPEVLVQEPVGVT